MDFLEAQEEYMRALKLGQKEHRLLLLQGKEPNPAVLDELLADTPALSTIQLGSVEILYDRSTDTFTTGSRTRTGIELSDPSTGLATVPNVANLSPYAQADHIRTQKTQRLLVTGLAILGVILAAAVIAILCSLS